MPRNFDGVDDVIVTSLGACGGVGALTIATLCRRSGTANWDAIFTKQSGGTPRETLEFQANATVLTLGIANGSEVTVNHGLTSTNWNLIIVTKAAGSATPRLHAMPIATRTWAHTNYAAAIGNATDDADEVRIGDWSGGGGHDYFGGDIAFAGYYERELTDAEVEAVFGGLNLQQMLAAGPTGFWLLDQESNGVPVADLTGNRANQTGVTGTTASTQGPPLWSDGAHAQRVQRVFASSASVVPITTHSYRRRRIA